MKIKALCISLVILSCTYLTGCMNVELVSSEDSAKNLVFYKEEIMDICKKYDVKVIDSEEERLSINLYLSVDEDQKMEIDISNSSYYEDDPVLGREDFWICYTKPISSDYNVGLFVEIVNVISGRPLSKEFCKEFLSAPEEDYPCEKYGNEKESNEITYKLYCLNFFEDWVIADTVYKNNTEELIFRGLTKTGTKDQ